MASGKREYNYEMLEAILAAGFKNQTHFAQAIGMNHETVANLLKRKRKSAYPSTVVKIAAALNRPVKEVDGWLNNSTLHNIPIRDIK